VRSPHARAHIRSIDASRVRAQRGVRLVLTAAELGALNQPTPLLIPHPELTHPRTPYPLAVDEVRYAGELVALVVADDRYLAQDAAQLIDIDYEPLPAVVELEAAGADGAPRVHAEIAANRAARIVQHVGDPDAAFARAAHVFRERLTIERSCGSPMETRGVVAEHDVRTGILKAWISTQAPLPLRSGLARIFGLPEFKVEVIAPDVGGGFGTKIMLFYPEEILVPAAAIRLGRAVKWIEDRAEHLTSSSQERGQLHDVEVATDEAGRILALRDRFLHDTGAYTPYGIIVPLITAAQLPGPYKLPHYHVEFEVHYTNKVMVTPYRGAGRPQGAFVMERVIGSRANSVSSRAKCAGATSFSLTSFHGTWGSPSRTAVRRDTTAVTTRRDSRWCWSASASHSFAPSSARPARRGAISGSASRAMSRGLASGPTRAPM
jgi:carbon-monoxide dehydrogenase large subunit